MNLSLRRRMQVAFGLSTAIVVVMGLVCWRFLAEVRTTLRPSQERLLQERQRVEALRAGLLRLVVEGAATAMAPEVRRRCRGLSNELLQTTLVYAGDLRRELRRLRVEGGGGAPVPSDTAVGAELATVERIHVLLGSVLEELVREEPRSPVLHGLFLELGTHAGTLADAKAAALERWEAGVLAVHERLERNLLLCLTLAVLGGLLLMVFGAPDVATPVKRFLRALREVRDANFGTRVSLDGDDELTSVAAAFNQTLDGLEAFEDLRRRELLRARGTVARLADAVEEAVIVVGERRRVAYMNNRAYGFFRLTSDEAMGREIDAVTLPAELTAILVACVDKGIRTHNQVLTVRRTVGESDEGTEVVVSASPVGGDGKSASGGAVLVLRPVGAPLPWPALE